MLILSGRHANRCRLVAAKPQKHEHFFTSPNKLSFFSVYFLANVSTYIRSKHRATKTTEQIITGSFVGLQICQNLGLPQLENHGGKGKSTWNGRIVQLGIAVAYRWGKTGKWE